MSSNETYPSSAGVKSTPKPKEGEIYIRADGKKVRRVRRSKPATTTTTTKTTVTTSSTAPDVTNTSPKENSPPSATSAPLNNATAIKPDAATVDPDHEITSSTNPEITTNADPEITTNADPEIAINADSGEKENVDGKNFLQNDEPEPDVSSSEESEMPKPVAMSTPLRLAHQHRLRRQQQQQRQQSSNAAGASNGELSQKAQGIIASILARKQSPGGSSSMIDDRAIIEQEEQAAAHTAPLTLPPKPISAAPVLSSQVTTASPQQVVSPKTRTPPQELAMTPTQDTRMTSQPKDTTVFPQDTSQNVETAPQQGMASPAPPQPVAPQEMPDVPDVTAKPVSPNSTEETVQATSAAQTHVAVPLKEISSVFVPVVAKPDPPATASEPNPWLISQSFDDFSILSSPTTDKSIDPFRIIPDEIDPPPPVPASLLVVPLSEPKPETQTLPPPPPVPDCTEPPVLEVIKGKEAPKPTVASSTIPSTADQPPSNVTIPAMSSMTSTIASTMTATKPPFHNNSAPTSRNASPSKAAAAKRSESPVEQFENEGGPLWQAASQEAERLPPRPSVRLADTMIIAKTQSRADVDVTSSGSYFHADGAPTHPHQINGEDDAFIINATFARKRVRVVQLLCFGLLGFLLAFLGSFFVQSTCHFASVEVAVGQKGQVFKLHYGLWKYTPIDSAFQGYTYCSKYDSDYTMEAPLIPRTAGIVGLVGGAYALIILWLYLINGRASYCFWVSGIVMAFVSGICQGLTYLFFFGRVCSRNTCSLGPGAYLGGVATIMWFLTAFEMYYNMPTSVRMSTTHIIDTGDNASTVMSTLEMSDLAYGASAYMKRLSSNSEDQLPTLNAYKRRNGNGSVGGSIVSSKRSGSGSYQPPKYQY